MHDVCNTTYHIYINASGTNTTHECDTVETAIQYYQFAEHWSQKPHGEIATATHWAPRVLLACFQVACKAHGMEAVPTTNCADRFAQLTVHRLI